MQTATDFISERGSTDFQMNEISDRCNLSKGALYYYFIDKSDLMGAIFQEVVGNLADTVEQAVQECETPLEGIYSIVLALVDCIRRDRPLVFAMVEELFVPVSPAQSDESSFSRVIALLERYLDDAKADGLIKDRVNTKLAANAIAGACIYTALGSVPPSEVDPEGSVEGAVRSYLRMVMLGAATEKGVDVINNY